MSRFEFERFGAVDQDAAQALAKSFDVTPLHLRIMFASMGWSNLIGHAEFADKALARILRTVDRQTGEESIPTERGVRQAIRRAEQMGLISHGSDHRCLRAPSWFDKAGGIGGRSCARHGIKPVRRARETPAPERSVPVVAAKPERSVPVTGTERSGRKPLTCDGATSLSDSPLSTATTDQQGVA